jgi:hypothetical protein
MDSHLLHDQDVIRIGGTDLVFQISS